MEKDILRHKLTSLLTLLAISTLLAVLFLAWRHVERVVADEEAAMLYTLTLRAQSLGWAVEGAARLHPGALEEVLREMGQQPGISYIALVDKSGRIMEDSNPALAGQILYTPQELASLAPGNVIQGRFSPDNANVFETWKIYNPERGHRPKKHLVLFIGMDATDFQKDLTDYRNRILLEGALLFLLLLCSMGLAYFVFKYQHSRRHLEDSKALAQQIIQSYPSPLLVTDLGGGIRFSNEYAREFFAMGDGTTNLAALPGINWETITGDMRRGETVFEKELKFTKRDGSHCPISFSDAIVRDRQAVPVGWLFVLRDLSPIKELERQLAKTQRLAALGHLAAGIAHEIRNPLSSIRGYAEYLRERLQDNAWAATTAALLQDEAVRLDRALSDLLLLSKKPSLHCESNSVGSLLRKLQMLLEPDTKSRGINVHLALPLPDISVTMDRDRILQALLNIGLNAAEATEKNGEVILSAATDEHNRVVISIKDNGRGIKPEDLTHIFTPYFTTRAEGTGLGLTVARQIVEAHGGHIEVDSTPGQGTIFRIYLLEEPCPDNL